MCIMFCSKCPCTQQAFLRSNLRTAVELMHPTVPDGAGHAICNDGSWVYPHVSPFSRHGHARSNASHAQHARNVPRCPHGIPRDAHGPATLWLHGPRAGGHPHADGISHNVWCLSAASGDAICNACHEPRAANAAAAAASASDGQPC